jgi:hypothetical protein
MITSKIPASNTEWIDWGYDAKWPWCVACDNYCRYWGLRGSGIWSFTGSLNAWYRERRPPLRELDRLLGLPNADPEPAERT